MIEFKVFFRDIIAAFLRKLPNMMKGKQRLINYIENFFGTGNKIKHNLRIVEVNNLIKVKIDLRSLTEKNSFYSGEYDFEFINWVKKIVKKNWTVFDIGANIGFWSCSLGKFVDSKKNGKVIAIEPAPTNFMRLRENILINELNKVIETFQVALGAGEKNITINIVEKSPTGNAYIGDKNLFLETTTASYEVRMKKFDDFFVEKQIKNCDFIKIDVEGFEIDFLKGGLSIIKKFRPIILGEFNNWFIKQYGYDFEEVYELMLPLNYSFYIYKENKWQLFNGKKNNTDNLLLVPSERKEEVFC